MAQPERSDPTTGNQQPTTRITLLVVLFLFAVNLFFYSGRFHSIDEMALLATTESAVKWQRTDINALAWGQWLLRGPDSQGLFNVQGDLYAKKAPLVAWLAAPIYALAGLAQFGQVQASALLNALVVALTGGVVFRFARRLRYSVGISVWAALLFGLGTSALVYAKYLFGEPLAGLGFLLAAEAVWRARNQEPSNWRALALGGAGLGAAFLTNPVNAAFAPIFIVALLAPDHRPATAGRRSPSVLGGLWSATCGRDALAMLGPFALALAALSIWNLAHFGSPLVTGYHLGTGEGFTSPLRISLPGMLISPARGFIWFVPASFLAMAGLVSFFKRHTRLAWLSLALVAGHVLAFGAWWMWWSGWGWGPRFLVPITPFVALMALPALDYAGIKRQISNLKGRTSDLRFDIWYLIFVVLVSALSIGIQILGASAGFDEYENIMTQTHLRGDPEGDLYKYGLDMLWSWKDSPIIGHANLVQAGNTDLAWLPRGQVDWTMLAPLVAWAVATGVVLGRACRKDSLGNRPARLGRYGMMAVCAALVILVLWRAKLHPLRATYGLDPTEGYAALDAVMSDSRPGDGVMLVRQLTPTEMDRFPRFPPVVGVPDEEMFGAEWNTDLERLVDNAQERHRRLWLVVRSKDDLFAAQIAARLKQQMRQIDQAPTGNYAVVLFEPNQPAE